METDSGGSCEISSGLEHNNINVGASVPLVRRRSCRCRTSGALAPTSTLLEDGRPRPSCPESTQSSFAGEIFSRTCQESSERLRHCFEQDPVFSAKAIFAIAFNAEDSKLARSQLHGNEYFGSGLWKRNFSWRIATDSQRLLRPSLFHRKEDADPRIVTSAAQ